VLAFEITGKIAFVRFKGVVALTETFLQGGKLFGAERRKRIWRERTSVQTRASSRTGVRKNEAAAMCISEQE
jgi:hypothetical protein